MDNSLIQAKKYNPYTAYIMGARESRQRLMDIAVDNQRQYLAGNSSNVVVMVK